MRVLILGGTGFLGPHLGAACHAAGDEVYVTGRDASRVRWPVDWAGPATVLSADVKDAQSITAALERVRPDRIFLLAALAHVARSEAAAEEALLVNAIGTQRVLDAVRRRAPAARVLCAGSCLEYGAVPADRQPIREDELVEPWSAYGVSRACGSLIARRFALEGLFVVRTRSFNHTGRGQRPEFALPSFADQLLRGRARGERVVPVRTGDLGVVRDYSGVRAAAAAYRALLELGRSGAVYNVCSGEPRTLGELLDRVASFVGVEVAPTTDPSRQRAGESGALVGDPGELERATGLTLRGSLDHAIRELVREREEAISASPA